MFNKDNPLEETLKKDNSTPEIEMAKQDEPLNAKPHESKDKTKESISTQEASIDEALKVNETIPEFRDENGNALSKSYFEDRYQGKEKTIAVAYINGTPVGYAIAYDRDNDGSIYFWMSGVNPEYRRHGVLRELMEYRTNWAKEHGYEKIKIKVRNERKGMLNYLLNNDFQIVDIIKFPEANRNEIVWEKII